MRDEIIAALEPILFGDYRQQLCATIRAKLEGQLSPLKSAFAARHAVAVHSGTIGLFLALRACDIGPGDEVITVANSDISTTGVISQCGATPVLCDVLESDYTIDPALVESLITPRTRAILAGRSARSPGERQGAAPPRRSVRAENCRGRRACNRRPRSWRSRRRLRRCHYVQLRALQTARQRRQWRHGRHR